MKLGWRGLGMWSVRSGCKIVGILQDRLWVLFLLLALAPPGRDQGL